MQNHKFKNQSPDKGNEKMKKELLAILAIIAIGVVFAVIVANNNYFSTNIPNESTPAPTISITPTLSLTPTPSSTPVSVSTATPTLVPTPSAYAMTINYSEIDRRNVENGTGVIMPIDRGVFITIAITAQINDGSIKTLNYNDFYLTVDGAEVDPVMQLSGSFVFNSEGESTIWMIFKEIGSNYKLNYRDNSFNIEWNAQ